MKRAIICSGGNLGDWASTWLQEADIRIGADKGALFLIRHGWSPDIAVGDFDSVTQGEFEAIRAGSKTLDDCDAVEKDYTDTELAFRRAAEQGATEILILGGLGTRLDHSLANVHLLVQAMRLGIQCSIIDEHNRVRLADRELIVRSDGYANVSLLPLTPEVRGVTLDGFRYPLTDATLTMGQSLGISNVLIAEQGRVRVSAGLLLVMQSRD